MSQPLAGIRVIELANFIAGPFAGMLLGDLGADVVKIEPPGRGDMTRAGAPRLGGEAAGFMTLNRNKRSLALDLKQPEAVEVVRRLVRCSDVLLENFRPGALEKLGLGAEAMRALQPDLVYVSVSGFGQTGPDRRKAAVNLIVEAASGMLSVMGEPGGVPARPGIQSADVVGALFAVYAVQSALIGKLRFGEGRTVDLSMLEGAIAAAFWETSSYLATGEVPTQLGRRHRMIAPYQLFETRDGFLAIGAANDGHFSRLLEVLDLPGLADDPRFVNVRQRKANDQLLSELLEVVTRQWSAAELEAALDQAGIPASRVNDYQQVFQNRQVVEREMLIEVDHPRAGRVRTTRNPLLFDRDGPRIERPAPLLGQHTRELLAELEYSEAEIERLLSSGAAALG